jgi:sporulation protein YlmC with PRC-barrel domain
MKFKTITAVSVLTLMMFSRAYAADVSATAPSGETTISATPAKDNSILGNVKTDLRKADASLYDTASDIKVFFIGKNTNHKLEPTLIHNNTTAHGLIGATILNTKGEKIATVKDIIVNKQGRAALVVVSDGGLLGIGNKVAAFDYNKVITENPDGKVVMSLSENMVDHAADFSYDQADFAKAKVIPAGSISVNALLKGNVVDNNGKKLADIENIYLRNDNVSQIIVGFNKTLGMGGDLAALDYDDLQMIKKNHKLNFKLTSSQTAQFKNFKTSVAK